MTSGQYTVLLFPFCALCDEQQDQNLMAGKSLTLRRDLKEEADVWNGLLVSTVGLQCPFSPVCGLRTIYPALFTLHLQVSVKEKHTASWYAKRHMRVFQTQELLKRPRRWSTKGRTKRSFKTLLSYGTLFPSILCHGMLLTMEFDGIPSVHLCCTDSKIYRVWSCWSVQPPAEDPPHRPRNYHLSKAGRQWKGNYF